ncbi:unnamed protein product [Sphagnum jensenii]|uniref:NADH-plastoquinone oxidoreductase subunit 5 n=1 Tax=Sphagnum jensenii TaxID=128206 RepID=A0ABP1BH58_9BRYO
MGIIIYTWPENYGDPSKSKIIVAQFQQAASAITSDEKIALFGAIQSLFEGSMYTFVFLWTPALSPNKQAIPHGFIFATFMLASMLGSSLASHLLAHIDLKVESYMQLVFLVAAGSLCLPVLITVSSSKFPASLGVYVTWSLLLQILSFSDLSVGILLAGLLHSYSQVFGILLLSLFAGFCGNSGQASMNHRGHQMAALVRDECRVVIACMMMLDGQNNGHVHCMISMKLDLVL